MPRDDDDDDNVIEFGYGPTSRADPAILHCMAWAALRPVMLERLAILRADPPAKLSDWDVMLLEHAEREGIGELPPDVVARAERYVAEGKARGDAEVIEFPPTRPRQR